METIKKKMSCSGKDCFEDDFFNSVIRQGNISHLSYNGISVEQNPNIVNSFYELLKLKKPKRIIEIGTFHGGLTLIIRDLLDVLGLTDTELITYDVNSPNYLINHINKNNLNINVVVENLFSDNYSNFRSSDSEVKINNLIKKEGCSIILCDGGSKKNEFRLISPMLKFDDVIMAHDYCYDEEKFEKDIKGRFWNWMEIQNSDIKSSCVDNNLVDFLQEYFTEVAWVCKTKK